MEKFRFCVSGLLRVDAPAIPVRAPAIPIHAPAIPIHAPAIPIFWSGDQVIHRQPPSLLSFASLNSQLCPCCSGITLK